MRAKGKKIRRVASGAENQASDGAEAVHPGPPGSAPAAAARATGDGRGGSQARAHGDVRANGEARANGAAPAPAGPDGQAGDGPGRDRGQRHATGAPAAPRRRGLGRRSLRNWRVRSRLLLLVAIPTVTALIFGGFSIYSSVSSAQTYQRVGQLATLGRDVAALVQSLEDERDQTVAYIALGTNGGRANGLSGNPALRADANPQLTGLHQQWTRTNAAAAKARALAAQIDSSYPAQTQQAAASMLDALDQTQLNSLRSAATGTQLPLLIVAQKYGDTINTALGFNTDIAEGAADATLTQTVGVLGLVSVMKQDASQQRAILTAALTQGRFGPGELTALQNSVAAQQTTLQAFRAAATPAQLQLWNRSVSRSAAGQANADEAQALSLAASSGAAQSLGNDPTTPADWYGVQSNTIRSQMGSVEQQLVGSVIARAGTLHKRAIISASIVGAAVLLVLVLAMVFTIIVGRSMVRPLRRLRSDALKVAGVRLPEMVRQLSESDGEDQGQLKVQPIDVDSDDEIGEVARAFDQVHAEAVRLASNEARLRGNINAMFVNLSRRTQSLVERQIHLIDDLEQGEQDSDRLGSLFRLDHLATRMRRNSENLLVLAGHEAARRWTQPVALVDVLRAAVSEIEHYERVVLNVQPGIAVRGQVVNDVVHLLAELVENATAFSSAQTQVNVSGHLLNSGGVLLDITDQGVGMADDEMAQANWRLDNPPVVDVAVSRRMGLFVVARLASRHGIRVRLRPAASGGLTALIWLPDETVTHEDAERPSGLRRFEMDTPGASFPVLGLEQFTPDGVDALDGLNGADGLDSLDSRAAAQAAVAAARAPRFMALGPGTDDTEPVVPAQAAAADDGPLTAGNHWALPGRAARSLSEPDAEAGPELGDGPLPRRDAEAGPGLGDGPLPRRDAAAGPGLGDGPLPRRGDSPLPVRGSSSFSFGGNGAGPGQQNGSGSGWDDKSVPGRENEAEPVFGAPVTGLANGFAASATDRTAGLPGSEPDSPLSDSPLSDSLRPDSPLSDSPLSDSPLGLPPRSEPSAAGPDSFADDMHIPSAPTPGEQSRLPIFESVESDWFRRGGRHVEGTAQEQEIAEGWASPADEGWRAAEAAESPVSSGLTTAGLPRRVPRANLVPGGVAETERAEASSVTRSAAATRERMASFQRGALRGRAALGGEDASGGEDEDAP